MAMPDETPAFEFTAAAPMPPESSNVPSAPDLPPVLHTVPQSIPEPMPFANGVSLGAEDSELRGTEPPILTPLERAARAEIYAKLASSQAKERATPLRPTSDPFGDFSNSARMNWTAPASSGAPAGRPSADPLPSSTVGGWLLALSPWLGVGALAFYTFQLLNGAGIFSLPIVSVHVSAPIIAVCVLAGILPFIFAGVDRAGLRAHGHDRRPSWWWMILGTLAYFIARTATLTRRSRLSFIPFVVWVGNSLAASLAFVLLLPAFIQGMVQVEVEKQLAEESAAYGITEFVGASFDVKCPDGVLFPPFTCSIYSDNGFQVAVDVTFLHNALHYSIDESSVVRPPGR